jgi:xanthine dehydrogenase/oxidase
MSLYAMIRNSYNPITKCFHLSESDIEMEGHLDGNLCRCTGYKPILKAAKTFITEDLKGQLISDFTERDSASHEKLPDIPYRSEMASGSLRSPSSCGRPGGCCRDPVMPAAGIAASSPPEASSSSEGDHESSESDMTSSISSVEGSDGEGKVPTSGATYGKPMKSREKDNAEGIKTTTNLEVPIAPQIRKVPQYEFKPYSPNTELVFPPSLRKMTKTAIFYGDSAKMWLRPVTLEQLLEIKNAFPSAKLVGGSSEVQVEVKFKNTPFAVSVYVSEIDELKGIALPDDLDSMTELTIGANTSLTDVESTCKMLFSKLGQKAQVLEAARKQLRYFAGRQIRNVASLAGNIATASPISDMNPVLLAANAHLVAQSVAKGTFTLPLSTFFVAYRTTSLPVDAVITSKFPE